MTPFPVYIQTCHAWWKIIINFVFLFPQMRLALRVFLELFFWGGFQQLQSSTSHRSGIDLFFHLLHLHSFLTICIASRQIIRINKSKTLSFAGPSTWIVQFWLALCSLPTSPLLCTSRKAYLQTCDESSSTWNVV